MFVKIPLDADMAQRLAEIAAANYRLQDDQALVLLRRALKLPVPRATRRLEALRQRQERQGVEGVSG